MISLQVEVIRGDCLIVKQLKSSSMIGYDNL